MDIFAVFGSVVRHCDQIEKRIDRMEGRLDGLEKKIDGVSKQINDLSGSIDSIQEVDQEVVWYILLPIGGFLASQAWIAISGS